jgi:hypothetical protein
MKTSFVTKTLGVLALLGSSTGMAASVQIIPSAAVLTPGQTFTLTVQADVANTLAATMNMAFDATRVAFVSGAVTGLFNGSFVKNTPVTANPAVFDIDATASTGPNPGTYNAAILTFQVLANAPGIGPTTSLVTIDDDGGILTGWFDTPDANPIAVSYTQATMSINAVPVPAAAWLVGPAVLAAARFSRRRKAA